MFDEIGLKLSNCNDSFFFSVVLMNDELTLSMSIS